MKTLNFYKKNKRWYLNMNIPFVTEAQKEMVAGADTLLEDLSEGHDTVSVQVSTRKKILDGFTMLTKVHSDGLQYGATYTNLLKTIWLCPVTLLVFLRYPQYLQYKLKTSLINV